MDRSLAYQSLDQHLVDAVPELSDRVASLPRAWEPERPGPHVVFGDALNPYLIELLACQDPSPRSRDILRRIFALLERMARHDDPRVQEVVSTTVAERLGGDPVVLAEARRHMGQATRGLSEEIEAFWSASPPSDARQPEPAVAGSG